jgi:hypothetical protein
MLKHYKRILKMLGTETFTPRSVHLGFVMDNVAAVLFWVLRFLPCNYHSTNDSYSLIYHRFYITLATDSAIK